MTRLAVNRRAALAAVLACLAAGHAPAQDYPTRPVRLIVPFSPGGGTDITARAIAHELTERWGRQVVVDNRGGASGNVGAEIVARSAPDGYTLLTITATHTVYAALQPKASYDLLGDFAPLTLVTSLPYLLVVNPGLPARSIRELVALSKTKPGGITYGSSGIGSLGQLAGALLASSASAQVRYISYKGGAAAVIDVMAGQIDMAFPTVLQAPQVRLGKLRALAVTSTKRSSALPEVPTMIEAGVPGYDINQWNGLMAPRRTPAALVERLSREVNAALERPNVRTRLAAEGSEAVGTTPQAFDAHLRAEVAKWKKLSQEAGIRIE